MANPCPPDRTDLNLCPRVRCYAMTAYEAQQAARELAKFCKEEAVRAMEEREAADDKPPPFRPPKLRRSSKPPKMSTSFATRNMCRHPSARRAFRTKG